MMKSSGHSRTWPRVVTVIVLAIALLTMRDVAGAQEATTPPTAAPLETGAAAGTGGGDAPDGQQTALSGTAKAWLVGGLLVLAVVTVAMHYLFLSKSRQEYFRTASLLFRQGVYPRPVPIPAQGDAPAGVLGRERLVENDGTIATLEVIGPSTLTRGQQGVYVALLNGGRDERVAWTVDPADAAIATPATGAVTNVAAAREGAFSLTASILEQGLTATPQTIAVQPEAPPASDSPAPGLPFIGQGFASLVGAVVLIAAVVVLAAIDVDNWEVIGTIFGALAGYLFGTATNNRE